MANRDVFPTENWQWPVTEAEVVTARLGETIGQLRRDRDELVAALEAALRWVDQLGGEALMKDKGDARDVLARIKAGG